jgi:DNA-binding response OmpR family regulator
VTTVEPVRADDGAGRFARSQPRVLVVEDDSMIAAALSEDLREFGFVVIGPARSLAAAVAIASTSELDCALIDVALGGESALAVAQLLTERRIPFLFMTGDSECLERTFKEVPALLKPFTVKELRIALQRILSS